jgi:Immunity protein 53
MTISTRPDLLEKLEEWYGEQCNGLWEHGSGVHITTLDNPGWMVKINLRDTGSEDAPLEALRSDNGEIDWFHCFKRDGEFVGAGDPSKLRAIIEHFLKFVGRL